VPDQFLEESNMNHLKLHSGRHFAVFPARLIFLMILTACTSTMSNEIVTPATNLGIKPVSTSGTVTLFSNFDPNRKVDFTIEGNIDTRNEQAFFDFDKGEITITTSADIYLFVSCGTTCFNSIIELNGAKPVWFGNVEPGYEGCRKALQEAKSYLWISNVPGNYSCLQSNEGNIIQILAIENESLSNNAKFVFEYSLWPNER
jgi:hypothetical protein